MTDENPRQSCGFTLLEVLIALGIAAVGLIAISSTLDSSVSVAERLESQTVATWVASNRMAELRMNRDFISSGSNISNQKMAGRDWKIIENYFATEDPNISRVVVEVSVEGEEFRVVQQVGYLARYKPAQP